MGALREAGDREVLVEVVGEPALDGGDRRRARGLRAQLGRELGLAARAAGEHDEPGRHLVGQLGAVVVLHQREGEVDAGGHPGGGPAVAIAHVDLVGGHLDLGRDLGEQVAVAPVGGGAPAVEEAGGAEQQRPGAHRRGAAAERGEPAQVAEQGVVVEERSGAGAADDHERVELVDVFERDVGLDRDPRGGAGGPAADRRDAAGVVVPAGDAVGGLEHLERTGEVEQLEAVEGDEDDGSSGHGGQCAPVSAVAATTRS